MKKILCVDDNRSLLRLYHDELSDQGYEVILAKDGKEALLKFKEESPHLVILDIRMPGIDGLEATRRIVGDPSTDGCRVLVLTTFDHDENVFAALRAGASGFLPKDTEPERLLEALRVVASGEALLAPHATRRLIEEFRRGAPPMVPVGPALDALTDREAEVLAAVAAGLSNAEIAQRLVISYATAKTHVSRLLTKLDARDRAQLVIIAYEHGLVQPGG